MSGFSGSITLSVSALTGTYSASPSSVSAFTGGIANATVVLSRTPASIPGGNQSITLTARETVSGVNTSKNKTLSVK